MKRKRTSLIASTTAAVVILLSLSTCSAFFLPKMEQTNTDEIVSLVENLDAAIFGPDTIQLTWTLPETLPPSSLIIVRNSERFPTDIHDGTIWTGIDETALTWLDRTVENNTDYYYGIWSVTADGTAAGPATVREAITEQSMTLYPTLDGYTSDIPVTNFTANLMSAENDNVDRTCVALFKFDFTGLPGSETIISAGVSVNVTTVATDGDTDAGVDITEAAWDETVIFSDAILPGFADNNAGYFYPSSTGYIAPIDVTQHMDGFIDGTFTGFRISSSYNMMMVADHFYMGTNEGGLPATLTIEYYGETY